MYNPTKRDIISRSVLRKKERDSEAGIDIKKQLQKIRRLEAITIATAENKRYAPNYKKPLSQMLSMTDDLFSMSDYKFKKYSS